MVVQFERVAGEGKVRPEQAGAKYSLAVPPRVARVVLPGRHVFVDAIERRGDLRVVEEPDDYVPVLQPVLVVLLRDGCHRPRSYFLSIVPITPKLRGCRRPGARCCRGHLRLGFAQRRRLWLRRCPVLARTFGLTVNLPVVAIATT